MTTPMLVIHGGCGTAAEGQLSTEGWREVREHLAQALRCGFTELQAGGSAVDAVEAAVAALEDSPHFNAGHGAALTEEGTHELDASIMDGRTLAAGAVCAVRHLRHPVRAARQVMERSGCVLLAGEAADRFGRAQGLQVVANEHFTTPPRREAWRKVRAAAEATPGAAPLTEFDRHGTVGAVALDRHGHLAAATSTGGFNNKPAGRIGDSPIIGAGTYARDGVAAVSCTGQGELFIRHAVAYDLVAQMRYAGRSLQEASDVMMGQTLAPHRIGAGWVALDTQGQFVAPFNTLGMARGWVDADGRIWVGTHRQMLDMGPA